MSEQPQRQRHTRHETGVQSAWIALSPSMRDVLFDPESWRESLDAYAHTTNLGVALVNVEGRLLGPCLNPRPTWSRLHAAQGAAGAGCPFAVAPSTPCTCVGRALFRRELVLVQDRAGLVHFTLPLVLDGHPVGALLAGQVFDQYPEQLRLEHVARHLDLPPGAIWQTARLELPVKRATLYVYGHLLAALGNAFLHTRYYTLMDTQRLEVLEHRFQERTIALYKETVERQRLEAETRRAEHFAQLGRLAAGVSHEIRNPLGAIFLQVDLLTEELQKPSLDSPAVLTETLAEIRTQLERLQDLVQDHLSLVRVGTSQPMPQDLGSVLQTWAAEFQALAVPHGVLLQLEGLAELGFVAFHATTLRRAVLNLVQNALEAMPQGGTLTLTGRSTPTHTQIQIRDTGSGMPSEQRAKIFEPLYTTKPEGTGLGLYIVQEIVAAHEGQVTVESTEGHGTTFTLTLPRAVGKPMQQVD